MSVINTGSHPKFLWPGIKAIFGAKYNEYPSEYPMIFDIQSSSQNFEEDVQTTGFGLFQVKPEGSGTGYDSHLQGYISRYTHVAYSLGYIVTKEENDDNLYEKVASQRAASLAFSAVQTRENVGANVLNRAFSSSYLGGDGKELLATDHPLSNGSTFANEITGADLSEASLEDVCILIGQAPDAKGLKISLRPKRLIIPITEQFNAARILKSVQQNDTGNNAINAIRVMGAIPEMTVNHYLTSDTAFFVKTDAPEGLKWYDRVATEFKNDGDFDTDNLKHKAYMRFSAGWSDPRGMFGSEGA